MSWAGFNIMIFESAFVFYVFCLIFRSIAFFKFHLASRSVRPQGASLQYDDLIRLQ